VLSVKLYAHYGGSLISRTTWSGSSSLTSVGWNQFRNWNPRGVIGIVSPLETLFSRPLRWVLASKTPTVVG
jgi:hypothetical protein